MSMAGAPAWRAGAPARYFSPAATL